MEVPPFFEFWVGLLGLLLGSFANVVIYRLPQEKSVVRPRSACPHCGHAINWKDNIPVFSWLILRGKCRSCRAPISARYPLVELLMGILFLIQARHHGATWTLLEMLILTFGLVVISFIDLDHMIIPDQFSLSGIALGLLGATLNPERDVMDAAIGLLAGGGFLLTVAVVYTKIRGEEGLGGGDIKLLAWTGAVLGWRSVPFTILVGSIAGSIVGIAMSIRFKSGLKTQLPFGPYLAGAALLFSLSGTEMIDAYLSLFFPWMFPQE
ncbi:MAG: prepilin peptidase [Bdellovibrionales bacterium]|nr:prepilin peptidase [Bdellovibrionales bacterium]